MNKPPEISWSAPPESRLTFPRMGLLALAACAGFAPLLDPKTFQAASPFGWWHVAVAQALASLWFTTLLAAAVGDSISDARRRLVGVIVLPLGVGFALATWLLAENLGPELDALEVGFVGRAIVRTLWCIALEGPFCLALNLLEDRSKAPPAEHRLALACISLAVATLLPLAYVSDEVGKLAATTIPQQVRQGDLRAAQDQLTALSDLGCETVILNKSPAQLRDYLARRLLQLEQEAKKPLGLDASEDLQLNYASVLTVLGRTDEAREVLLKMADTNADAALALGALLERDKKWSESDQWYLHAEELLGKEKPDAANTESRIRAIDALAFNARAARRPREAEALYLKGIEKFPERASYFRFQLARHYHLGGRHTDALRELGVLAAEKDGKFAAPARMLVDDIRLTSPACVLSPPVVLEQIR